MKNTLFLSILTLSFLGLACAGTPKTAEPTKVPTVSDDPLAFLGSTWKDVSAWTEQTAKDVKSKIDKVDPADGDGGVWIHQAAAEAGSWWKKATIARAVLAGQLGFDSTGPNDWVHKAAADVQHAIDHMDSSGLGKHLKQASKDIGLNATLNDLQVVKLEDLPAEALQYIKDNPTQTVFYIIEGVAFFSPATVYSPLLRIVGFSRKGVKAGTLAARLQRLFGATVPAGSWFAHLTSAGAGGYGKIAASGLTRLGVLAAGAVNGAFDHASNTPPEPADL
ncbi:hypothetical protein LTR36_007692 [Oleoguttula mirabilis]|uniref:Uncharacterized protein n=1 Tax=Oleoguttula mirabilis TaxID=1507867 RepID=A0AAV9JUL5_9PEZI|nr:hypothetical protein LTR36_007692 [Oleoguttula mirabilis]